jgi:hypothetical protein
MCCEKRFSKQEWMHAHAFAAYSRSKHWTMKEEAVERAGNKEKGRIKNQDL